MHNTRIQAESDTQCNLFTLIQMSARHKQVEILLENQLTLIHTAALHTACTNAMKHAVFVWNESRIKVWAPVLGRCRTKTQTNQTHELEGHILYLVESTHYIPRVVQFI
jgi:hypothetical protein